MYSGPLLTFNPGPSQLTEETIEQIAEIAANGFLSESHRSPAFSVVSEQAVEGLREKMEIPEDYHIFYRPSATAAMETLLRNVVQEKSFHFVHGAFSKRFYTTAVEVGLEAVQHETAWDKRIDWREVSLPSSTELISITHNETSTGLMWPLDELAALRKQYPDLLLAVDVTSSFGAMRFDWSVADLWFGSVQKCLGMPAGLGYLIVSPRAFALAMKWQNSVPAWQRFEVLAEKMQKYQTVETPNMLAIALLAKKMESWDLAAVEQMTVKKARVMYQLPRPFVEEVKWRSLTVGNFYVDHLEQLYTLAQEAGIRLGNGYGPLREHCVRLANFPAITLQQMQEVMALMQNKNKSEDCH